MIQHKEHAASLSKLTSRCPACGRRTLKLYTRRDGSIIHPECGRCNREIKCAYHPPPREFPSQQDYRIAPQARAPRREFNRDYELNPDRYFLNPKWLEVGIPYNPNDPLEKYLCRLFPPFVVKQAYQDLGARYCYLLEQAVVFWQIDSEGRIRSGKVMRYDATGHRCKEPYSCNVNFVHCLEEGAVPGFKYQMCYFGEHYAAQHPDAALLVVESEKTALMLQCALVQRKIDAYVPIAVGGASCLSIDPYLMEQNMLYRNRIFRKRRVILLPDADMVDTWRSRVPEIARYASKVKLVDIRGKFMLDGSQDIGEFIERLQDIRRAKEAEELKRLWPQVW